MELNLAEKSVAYMRKILNQQKTLEESMEFVLPDTLPDLGEILFTEGTLTVRQKEKRGQDICISGGIMAKILYREEGGEQIICTDVYLPFSVKAKDVPADAPRIVFDAAVSSLDGRIVNSRKLSLRALISYRLCVYEEENLTYNEVTDAPSCLQMRSKEYRLKLPKEVSERNFTLSESVILQNAAEGENTPCCFPRLSVTEKRLAGDKVVFKGEIVLQILQISAEGAVKAEQTRIPFSHYCPLAEARQEAPVQLTVSLASFELQRTGAADGERLMIEAELSAQAVVYEEHCLSVYEDAYTTCGTLEVSRQELAVQSLLDCAQMSASCSEKSTCACDGIFFAVCTLGLASFKEGERDALSVPLTAKALCADREGKLFGTTIHAVCELPYRAAENVDVSAQVSFSAEPSVLEAAEGAELQCAVKAEVFASAEQHYPYPESIRLEMAEEKRKAPCVTVRRLSREEDLWDIAKASRTTVDALRKANRLEGDTAEAQSVLIIPTV